ncbi:hypothetical protein CRUP_014147 [Coryphaenoides rupestris]|nr:hypothetical protein CRUP_014147 [Coryphaenoides rupestris]
MAKILKNNTAAGKTAIKKTSDKKSGNKTTPDKKTAVKKREKKRKSGEKRKKGTRKTATKATLEKIDLDCVEDDDDLIDEGDEIVPSEDEDDRKHQKLLEAISALGGKKKRKLAERSEATIQISEFSVDAKGEGDKINLSDLIQTIANTAAVSAQTKAHLKKLQLKDKTVDSPLSKQETERIQRNVAFQRTAEEVSRWQSIIKQNQKAEQQVFPLNQEAPGPRPIEQVVCGWKARTPLEQEIFLLLSANKQPINKPALTPVEEESLKAMSLEDAKIRRAELQKARALQSYYEAKARRERSIKSKKYHKVHNKAKRKDFVKKFDEMLQKDPVGALEELQKLELGRMKERMSLKHQNSGKWAKSKAIMAKYDEGARKAMQQQLEVNKDLTQKLVTTLDDEGEDDDDGEAADPDLLPDFVNDAEPGLDPANPWMRGKLSKDSEVGDPTAATEQEQTTSATQAMFRIKNLEDMDLLDQEEQNQPVEPDNEQPPAAPQESEGGDKKRKRKRGIDLNEVLTKEAKVIQVPMVPRTVEDADGAARGQEEEEQRDVIKEAFAGDDVISDFLKDKRREEDAGKPNGWGGSASSPSRSKRQEVPGEDASAAPPEGTAPWASVISRRSGTARQHAPGWARCRTPSCGPEQFEATVRSPVGATWNTRKAVRKLTMPRVITKVGAIIQPMSRDDLLKHSRRQGADGTATARRADSSQQPGREGKTRRRENGVAETPQKE